MNPQRVAVVGMGLLGRGIVGCFLGRGFQVTAFSPHADTHGALWNQLKQMILELVEFGVADAKLVESWEGQITLTRSYEALRECAFVVESVTEDISIKTEVFDQIEAKVSDSTIIASNSSAIPISLLQQSRARPERFLAMHWAEPAHATRFMEIIPGEKTSIQTIKRTLALARQLGKEPSVLQKDIPGFIVNRIGYAMYREALNLIESGVADVETIDRSVRNAIGLWATVCGPFRWMDLTGGPELYAKAMEHVLPTLSKSDELPVVLQRLASEGARGIINGRGFYAYGPEEGRHWERLYRCHSW